MIGPEGPAIVPHYSVRKQTEDHDFMLPTEAHRDMMTEAYIKSQEGRSIKTRFGRVGRSKDLKPMGIEASHADSHFGIEGNPWKRPMEELYGSHAVNAAQAKVSTRAIDRIHAAPTFRDAVIAALPAAEIPPYQGHAEWPADVAAALYARARELGALDKPLSEEAPRGNGLHSGVLKDGPHHHAATPHDYGTVGRWISSLVPANKRHLVGAEQEAVA